MCVVKCINYTFVLTGLHVSFHYLRTKELMGLSRSVLNESIKVMIDHRWAFLWSNYFRDDFFINQNILRP